MKKFMENLGAFIVALFLFSGFWVLMLYVDIASSWLVITISSLVFLIFTVSAVKKKSFLMLTISLIISSVTFYLLYFFAFLFNLLFEKAIWLVTYLTGQAKSLTIYLAENGYAGVNYLLIGLAVLIVFLFLKKNWKRLWMIVKRVWNFLAELRVTTPIDEFHIVIYSGILFTKKLAVYSGNDISQRKNKSGDLTESAKAYVGNYYWNMAEVKVLNHLLGMKVHVVASDDLKKAVKNINVKTKDLAKINIGGAFIHFIIDDVLTAAKMWPGKDTDPEKFIESVTDIIEETVEIVTKDFDVVDLIGGSRLINDSFRKELVEKLEEPYGIKIINAKLSQENGEIVDLITDATKEEFRSKRDIARETAQQKIEAAKNLTQGKVNARILTEAEGKKKVIETDAEAEASRITKILKAQASQEIFKYTDSNASRVETAKALATIYQNVQTLVNGGGSSDLIGTFLALGKSLGVNEDSLKAISSSK
jgi:regulator of protease activity HflC (stomatin/prohibitin superfamily)